MRRVAPNLFLHDNGVYYRIVTRGGKAIWTSLRTKNLREAKRHARQIEQTGTFSEDVREVKPYEKPQGKKAAFLSVLKKESRPVLDEQPKFNVFGEDYLKGVKNSGLAQATVRMYTRCWSRLLSVLEKNQLEGENLWAVWERMENRGIWGYCQSELKLGPSDLNQMRCFLTQIAREAIEKTYISEACVCKMTKLQVVKPRQPQIPAIEHMRELLGACESVDKKSGKFLRFIACTVSGWAAPWR